MGRKENCKQISLACVGSAYALSVWATLGLTLLTVCVLSQFTMLRLQFALQGNCLKLALGCMHVPGLSSGSRVLHKGTDSGDQVLGVCTLSGCAVHLITSLVPAILLPGCTAGAPSQMYHVSLLGSWSLTVTVLVDVKHPGSQEDVVSNWEPASSLVEDVISGAEIAPFWLWLSPACLSASSVERVWSTASKLSSGIRSVLCSVSCSAEP